MSIRRTLLLLFVLQTLPTPAASLPGSLKGEVKADGDRPIAGAVIQLIAAESSASRPFGAAIGVISVRDIPFATVSDRDGSFEIRNITPGRYRLRVKRNGYVPMQYGQRGPNGPGRILTIVPGGSIEHIPVALEPSASISGRVEDVLGRPSINATVLILRAYFDNENTAWMNADFLMPIENRGVAVHLNADQARAVDVPVIP